MPPQQTNITSETERDAAGLGLGLPIALDAAGPTAASTRSVLSLLKRCWLAHLQRRRRQSLGNSLLYLSDRELMDIGLTRDEIDGIAPQRAIERFRDSATYLCSLGAM